MVVNKVSISMEGAKGAGQESTVLSRVRLLESGENSEGGTIATRENVRAVIHLSGATRTEATKHPSASAKLGGQELANATQERAKFVTAPRTSIRSSRESVGNQTRSSSKMDHTDLNSLISRESLHFSKGHHARQLPKVDSTVLNSSVLGEAEVPAYPTKSYHGQSPPKVNRSLPSSRTSHEPVEVFTNSSKGSQGRSSPRVDRTFSNTKPHTLTNASAHLANVFQGHPSPKVDFTISNSSSSREPVEVSADLAKGYQSRPSLKVVHTTFHTPVRRIETVQAREVRPISDVTAISPLDGFLKTNLPSKVDAVESHGANRSRRALSASPLRHARNVSPAPSRGRQVGEHDSNVTKNDPRDKTLRSSSLPRPSIDVTDTSGSEKSSSEGVRKRKDSPTMVSHVRAREKSNNVSQFFILKRHHWENRDDKNERPSDAPNGSREDSGRTESNSEPMMKNWKSENQRHVEELQWNALPQRKSADAELSWPSDNLEASRMGKPGTTAYTSSQVENSFPRVGRSYPVGQLGTTLGDFRLQNTCQKPEFNELKRNLNAASVVMYEEKASSAENSSSSGRSSLSHQELGVIAAKAFQLSMVQADTQAMRRENSPLHQILAAKRTRKISKEGKQSQEKEQPRENVVFAYSSAQRLSERLTRAERFTALKRTSTNFHAQNDDTFAGLDASSSSPSPEKSKHPVFGYRKQVVDTKDLQADETFNIPSEPSCVRRSKHLSKIMQQKADHFAACSPTQRNKHESGPTAPEHASRDPNPYFERIFAPRVSQPYRSGQAVKHNEETNSIAREHAQYRERNYRPDARHSSQRHNGFVKETKNQTMPRQSAATGDDKKFSHLQLRFNYPPGSRTNPGQAPNQREKEPFSTFDSRRSRYNTDEPLHEESLKDFAHGKRQQQTLGNKSGRIVPREENRDTEQPTILASEAVLEHDGIDDYSEGTSSSDEERARPEAPQRLPYSTWMASGSTSKVTTFPENFTKDIKKASPTELPNLRYDVREASGNSDKAFPRPAIAESRKYMQLGEPISASQTSSADEDKKGPGSHILTDFSENGNGTCGELSGHDTYTGSLNKHEIRMGSSDSSATTRPDAFLWLHQKYGTQNPTVADSTIPKRASWTTIQVKTNTDIVKNNVDNRAQVIEKNKESDDDDIFFGLEEEETAVGGESRKQEKTAGRNPVRPSRIRTDRSQFEASNTSATTTATQQPSSKPMLTPQTQLTHKDEVKKHSGKTINADETNKSVTSDISSSLIAEKGRKMSRYGPNTVDTIMEEAPVSASVDEDDPSLEEEPIQDENKPSNSVLRNISAIVNSLKHVCTIPRKSYLVQKWFTCHLKIICSTTL